MSLLFRAISIPMIAANAVAARLRPAPVIRADQVSAPEETEEPAEEQTESVLRIRLPGLPMSFVRDGELPLLRKSVRIFKSAQAMLDPVNCKVAYDLLTREKIGRSTPTTRERLEAIRLLMRRQMR